MAKLTTYIFPKKQLLSLFAFVLVTAIPTLFFVDQKLAQWLDHPDKDLLRIRARDITDFGLGEYWFGLAILLYVSLRWILPLLQNQLKLSPEALQKAANVKNWSVYYFTSLCTSGILLQIIKHIIGRERPPFSETHEALNFSPFTMDYHWHSMPSGHSETLFCVATSFSFLLPKWRWLFYGVSIVMSFTRVLCLQHFMSDTIVGMFIGVLGANLAWLWLSRKRDQPDPL